VKIATRLVIEVPGFDPRDLAEHHRDFAQEYRSTCELYGLTGKAGDAKPHPKRPAAKWDVTTKGDGWQVQTDYRLLRWDDIVRDDMTRAPWRKIVKMYRAIGVAVVSGAFRRILRTDWRFAAFAFSPLLLISAWIFLACFVGLFCMTLVAVMHAPDIVARIVGGVTGVGAFALILGLTEPITGLLRRADQATTTDQIANHKRKDIEQRMDGFAGAVVDAVQKSEAHEVIIVGHGLGAVLAIDVAGRVLARDPAFGEGRRVVLLTLGSNLPVVAFDPEAKWFRNRLRQLAVAPGIDWIDVQSPDDVMNVCPFDPVADPILALEAGERRNPTIVAVSFRDLWKPGRSAFRRLRFAWTHAQFVRANERQGAAYDYYLICCGPLDAMTRLTTPAGMPEKG
jgi:hypothetical protein